VETESLVGKELLAHCERSGRDGKANDNTEGQQLRWNLLQCPETSSDCMCAVLIFLCPSHCSCGMEWPAGSGERLSLERLLHGLEAHHGLPHDGLHPREQNRVHGGGI